MSSRGPLTSPGTLVLLRHGQSTWNLENLFTGWHDVPLSELGVAEAKEAGRLMHAAGLAPAIVHTSVLVRAIQTSDLALAEMNRTWIQVRRSWRLNERHYGALQGLNKRQTAERFGEDKVKVWRRSYDVRPPALEAQDERHPSHDPRYAGLPPELLPSAECLKDVVERMLPYWYDAIVPDQSARQAPRRPDRPAGGGPGHTDRGAEGLRARSRLQATVEPVPRRPERDRAPGGRGPQPGEWLEIPVSLD